MGVLYAKDGKIHCNEYVEIYIPKSYFETKNAIDNGASIETFGICYIKAFPGGAEGPLQMLNAPVRINLMVYDSKEEIIKIKGQPLEVRTLQYMKDSYIMHQSITKGREVAETFLSSMLGGKLPKTINYAQLIDLWWRNLEIAGVSFKVPSKIFEMIIASIYRNPKNMKERYGQYYGAQTNPSGMDYETGDVRTVVMNLSTFSGMVFENIGQMISNGINNSLDQVEEPVSPLEKIIHY